MSTSTSRQERQCREFARLRGWDVVEVYEDIDLSAYRSGVRRPDFERLQADLAGLDGVVVWRLDRLVRRPADFERFWGRCEELRVFLASATEPVDSSSEMGVAIVRILVTFAQLESHAKGARTRARQEERARAGLPPKREPCYGHTDGWNAIVPEEAELIRETARRFLAGESLHRVADRFNHEGRMTRKGRPWSTGGLRSLLAAHRMVGDRSFGGEVVATGCWPPILDREDFDEIQRRLAGMHRTNPMTRGLLTGWLICGRCGGRMYGRGASGDSRPMYVCGTETIDWKTEARQYCSLGVASEPTEAWVAHQLIWRSRLVSRWHPQLLRLVPAPVTEQAWALMTRDERRTHIDRHLERLVILPAPTRGGPWSESRLVPTWKEDLVSAPPFAWTSTPTARKLREVGSDWISRTEAADILGVSSTHVTRLRESGALPNSQKIGRSFIYNRREVRALSESRQGRRPSTPVVSLSRP